MDTEDTISAISTAMGRSGIGIVRLSGPQALDIAQRLFRPRSGVPLSPNRAQWGEIRDPQSGELIDEVVVTFFRAPRSYTGEDVVELSCHGSPVVLQRVLELTIQLGARIAKPGEFTLRAFLNGRLDLTQAEAVRDLIEAQTTYQARVAARQLRGSFSRQLQPIKDALTNMIVHLETAVEFADEDVHPEDVKTIAVQLDRVIAELSEIERSFSFGRLVREGIQLALVGRPNVGKSSIFNKLLKKERAIVTDIPGTTRDLLSDAVSLDGIPVHLIDTAGIRKTADRVESIGVERARTAIADADVVLVILDGSQALTEDDQAVLEETQSAPRLIVVNKSDLPPQLTPEQLRATAVGSPWIRVSALTGAGIDELRHTVVEFITSGRAPATEDVILTNSRHHDLIVRAIEALQESRGALEEGYSEEVILVGMHEALRVLGEITGETTVEDILDQIFSTFCIGK